MNVLLVRPDGIGDEILSLPVATELRRCVPDARVIFLSSEYAAQALQHHPDLDDIWTVTGKESLLELIRLFRQGVDAAIFLKPFRRLIIAAWLARVPLRVGTGYRWYSILLNRRVYQHRKDFARHESVYNVELLRGLGVIPGAPSPPQLVLTDEERAWARARLTGASGTRVVIHPGGFSSRVWQPGHFRDLTLRLAEEGVDVILTGNETERDRFRKEAQVKDNQAWPSRVHDFMGQCTLRQLMAVVAESHAVVSLATGPMHIAAALGVPTVSIFDPRRNNSPTRWKPLGKGMILQPQVPTCEKCIYEACPYWDCMDRVTVESVVASIHRVTEKSLAHEPLVVASV